MSKSILITAAAAAVLGAFASTANAERPAKPSITQTEQPDQRQRLLQGLQPADEIPPRMGMIRKYLEGLSARRASKKDQLAALQGALREIDGLDLSLAKLRKGYADVDSFFGSDGGVADVDALDRSLDDLRTRLEGAMKDLESQDKLGNFEIQDLMSRYNQAETLASSVQKKKDDTANSIIQKIG